MTPFVALHFSLNPECIHDLFSMSTMVGDSIVSRRVYRGCVVSICGSETLVDLMELIMLDFNMILRMDLLHSC